MYTAHFSLFCSVILISNVCNAILPPEPAGPTPIVMWHGMGDSCCFPFSMGAIKKKLEEFVPGVYVHSLKIGNNIIEDMEHGYFMHPDKQIEMACNIIKNDTLLAGREFNAMGFSQGGQFLRALVQRCPGISVKNLITFGGQHQGVYGLPNCGSLSNSICDYIRKLLNHAAYIEEVQKFLVQATYWHDPLHEEDYVKGSSFLSDINNEITINTTYISRLQALKNFVMVKFNNDTMVQPVETEWFGFYKPGQSTEVLDLEQSDIYINDRLGLKFVKMQFLSLDTNHLQFDWDWFQENILQYIN